MQVLFDRIAQDLRDNGKFEELQADYNQTYQINELKLRPMLYKWTTNDVEKMLLKVGFSSNRVRLSERGPCTHTPALSQILLGVAAAGNSP